ncbi:MAG: mannose-1-phosphate guanylyltransferase, partial [Odoribacter sp.]|nr:mannose-1-phosphate guanylyltransferase [Odoribacter sp.]
VENHGGLLTFGIKPTRIETEYGYIQEKKQKITDKVSAVKTFTEKPNLELAKTFYESGDFLWNAGMFIWQTEEIIYQIKKHIYDLYNLFETDSLINTPQEQEFIDMIYGQCPNISIDVGVLEKSRHVYVFKGNFGWSDIGSWHAFKAISEKDEHNNITNSSNVILKNTKNCIVNVPEDKEVVIYGVEDLIVAEKGKYLMICNAKDEEQIKFFDKILKYHKSETPF